MFVVVQQPEAGVFVLTCCVLIRNSCTCLSSFVWRDEDTAPSAASCPLRKEGSWLCFRLARSCRAGGART